VLVYVFDNNNNPLESTTTATTGDYKVGVPATTVGDTVCFDASAATGGTSTTGYASQCYKQMPWLAFQYPPAEVTPIAVKAGAVTHGVDAELSALGEISGTITATVGGGPIAGVSVSVFDSNGDVLRSATTTPGGTYAVPGLPPTSTGDKVCFDASSATGGSSALGYSSACYKRIPWNPPEPVPAGTSLVRVRAGADSAHVDATLNSLGGIAGTVTARDGAAGLAGVQVQVFDTNGIVLASATTNPVGSYSIVGLAPSTPGGKVCFNGSAATGGSSSTGYASECYKNVPWNPPVPPYFYDTPAAGATPVQVKSGTSTTVDASLPSLGSIAGIVTAAGTTAGLAGVQVQAFDSAGDSLASATTGPTGTYSLTGLAPTSIGYAVCFDGSAATGGPSTIGYVRDCYKGVPWIPSFLTAAPPAGSTPVPVAAGRTTTLDVRLSAMGSISGQVVAADGGAGLSGVSVQVYDTAVNLVGSATTTSGAYDVTGVPPAPGYTVCFDASGATGGGSTMGYANQCYKAVPWPNTGFLFTLPGGTIPVAVRAGATTTVDAALTALGGISGTVTALSGGAGLSGVSVDVYDANNNVVGTTTTASTGAYSLSGLNTTSTGDSVCFDATGATGGFSKSGYVSECFKGVHWNPFQGSPPRGTSPVRVRSGFTSTVDAVLEDLGAIAGRVTAAGGSEGLAGVSVAVLDSSGSSIGTATTGPRGSYRISGLTPTPSGYMLCFNGSSATGGPSTIGYASQCFKHVHWNPSQFSPPTGTVPVLVKAGATTVVNTALDALGAIHGEVIAAAGGAALSGVSVYVFDSGGDFLTQATTNASGAYSTTGLNPAAIGYSVCFDATNAVGGSSQAGYANQCYKHIPYSANGFPVTPPPGTTPVVVKAGQSAAIGIALTSLGGISGQVTAATGGDPLAGVSVQAFHDGTFVANTYTSTAGTYTLTGLPPASTGDSICFDASNATGGSSDYGYASQCYVDIPWDAGTIGPPPGTKPVDVEAGAIAGPVDAALTSRGAISGEVTAADGQGGLEFVAVQIFDADGDLVVEGSTSQTGSYTIPLDPTSTGYTVCFDASDASASGSTSVFASRCYDDIPWTPGFPDLPPAGTTPVPVAANAATTVDALLPTA
jgi:hypothetical protein